MTGLFFSPTYCVLLLLLRVASARQECGENLVTVYIDADSGNDTTCLPVPEENKPCKTLNRALTYRASCVSYVILSHSVDLYAVTPFVNADGLFLSSGGGVTNGSLVTCHGDAGLAFMNVSNIVIKNVSFMYCGAERNSTSKYFSTGTDFRLQLFRAALYFDRCSNLSMSAVHVVCSPNATGVVIYNTGGVNVIEKSVFSNNKVSDSFPGGGGFYLEFSYCLPGDSSCVDHSEYVTVTNASYLFESSEFSGNIASTNKSNSGAVFIIPLESNHVAFGRGGGLSVFFKGTSAYNTITISNCHFANNIAEWGGGSFVEFHDSTDSNKVEFVNCTFEHNFCGYELVQGTGGGGLRIGHLVFGKTSKEIDFQHGNEAVLTGCHFLNNTAMYGGGIFVTPASQNISNYIKGMESTVTVENSSFHNNTAMMGAALNINEFSIFSDGTMPLILLKDINVVYNTALYTEVINETNTPHTEGVSALYIHEVATIFEGYNLFMLNTHSGLAAVGTTLDFTNCHAVFQQNSGYRGGGISLLGTAYLLISEHTQMVFDSNEVTNEGGAIYNRYVEMDNIKTRSNCFIRHSDPFKHPDDWGALFLFRNNSHHMIPNAIHTSSILPCFWAGGNIFGAEVKDIFCWKNWTFLNSTNQTIDCNSQISSGAGNITFKRPTLSNDILKVNATPGWNLEFPIEVKDDYNRSIDNIIVFRLVNAGVSSYFWRTNTKLSGEENNSTVIYLESLGDRIWEIYVQVDFQPCPMGFVITDKVCTCPHGDYGGLVQCDSGSKNVTINVNNAWFGPLNSSNEYTIALCPTGFCNSLGQLNAIKDTYNKSLFCADNREGIVCGECSDGYGPAINSRNYDCIKCTEALLVGNIFKYLAAVYLPLTLLFIALIFFDIRLTTGPANAFIIYCQAMSSTFELVVQQVSRHSRIPEVPFLNDLYLFLYGIFNLEFFENLAKPWCLSTKFNTLTVFSLDYAVAIYPLLLILVALIFQKIKDYVCKCPNKAKVLLRFLFAPKRWRKSTIGEALLPAFAAFILLSYNKLGSTASFILASQPLVASDGSTYDLRIYFAGQYSVDNEEYLKYYLIPSGIAYIFTCVIPLLLLVYPLKVFEWCLQKIPIVWKYYPADKIHFFSDTFQGCYRPKMRFFAGLYFLFRLAINSAYLATTYWTDMFVVQEMACIIMIVLLAIFRPYKKEYDFLNYVDLLIFTILLINNSLSFYLYIGVINSQTPSSAAAAVQYILVFLPLLYMISYIIYLGIRNNRIIKNCIGGYRRDRIIGIPSKAAITQIFTTEAQHSEAEHEEDLLIRAENTNQYKRVADQHGEGSRCSVQSSNRPSGSLNRLSNVTQSTGSSKKGASLSYGACGTNSGTLHS